ncbi:sensor histidine kinase [Flavobacterium phycosphaerae]|uniref:sensor histidine kinase n=1 Tax=Flavobacterium phycosphaerae TaxID=2697515 RepID=UPI0013896FF6|nr:ATP-binding protein [Flavobacterium phycosphaerae]
MNKLTSTRLNLSILSDKNDPKTIKKCISYVADIFKIEQEIRSITHNMNQNMFKKSNSYYKLLFDFIKEQNRVNETNYYLELNQEIDWVNISSEIKMNLYRIIQEASNNINKHSKAKKAIISIVLDEKNICLSITDNGIGFCTLKKRDGIGIQNIEQRVKKLNGTIIIRSISNKSTTINISIPI